MLFPFTLQVICFTCVFSLFNDLSSHFFQFVAQTFRESVTDTAKYKPKYKAKVNITNALSSPSWDVKGTLGQIKENLHESTNFKGECEHQYWESSSIVCHKHLNIASLTSMHELEKLRKTPVDNVIPNMLSNA